MTTTEEPAAAPVPANARRSIVGRAGLVAAALSILAVVALLVWHLDRSHPAALSLASDESDYCYHPPTQAEWVDQAAHGVRLGLDVLLLPARSTDITVTAVSTIAATGGLVLDQVRFVPSAEVAGGPGGDPLTTTTPSLARLALALPARLHLTPKPADGDMPWDPRAWQLGFTVHAPLDAERATAQGFLITYKFGSHVRTLRTLDKITFVAPGQKC